MHGGDGEAGPSGWRDGDNEDTEHGGRGEAGQEEGGEDERMEQEDGQGKEGGQEKDAEEDSDDEDNDGSWLDTDAENDYDVATPISSRSTSSISSDNSLLTRNVRRWSDSDNDDDDDMTSSRLPPPPPLGADLVAEAGRARKS